MQMLTTTHQRMTATEFEALPVGPPYFELVDGELFSLPSPTRQHQKIILKLGWQIGNFLDDHPVGEAYIAPSDVKLSNADVFEPDVYFVSNERLGILTDQGATGAPDLVVEVLSPSTARLDLGRKWAVYLRKGVREIWFVWPEDRQVDVHLPEDADGEEPTRSLKAGDTLTTPLLPGWSLPVTDLFA